MGTRDADIRKRDELRTLEFRELSELHGKHPVRGFSEHAFGGAPRPPRVAGPL